MASVEKEIVLVLHHTYLHDTFRAYPEFPMEKIDQLKACRFILRYIIEKKTDDLTRDTAITSDKAYSDFLVKFKDSVKTAGAYKFLKILDKLIFKVASDQINSLNVEEGVMTISDKIFSTSSEYEPILVISPEAKAKFIEQTKAFYTATLKEKFTAVPFRILDYYETEAVLVDKYPVLYKIIKERVGSEPF